MVRAFRLVRKTFAPADPAGLISRLRRELADFSGGAPQSNDITMLSLWLA